MKQNTIFLLMLALPGLSSCAVRAEAPDFLLAGEALQEEIKAWKPGDEVPPRLLSFPSGEVPPRGMCGLADYAFSAAPIIEQIDSDALLVALMFDPRTESASLRPAILRLMQLKGIGWFAKTLVDHPNKRWELDLLQQALQSPFSRIEVAFIGNDRMDRSDARQALESLKAGVDNGEPWKDAYGRVADANPDIERRKREPLAHTTLVTYQFSGWVNTSGFSPSELGINPYVSPAHLETIVGSPRGGQIIESDEGVHLYYVMESWTPSAP